MPRRVQLRRSKGWRKPAGVVVVARPTRFGNPFRVGDAAPGGGTIESRAHSVTLFRRWLEGDLDTHRELLDDYCANLRELRGRDLACWCPPAEPCHADVLLDHANR